MKTRDVLALFNRGRISKYALARTDVSRVAMSAQIQTNWMPRTLGPMSLRPGFGFLGTNTGDGAYIPFVYETADTAILELSAGVMRVWDDGDTLVTRASVSSTVTNGTFTSDLSGWTDADDAGASSTWDAGGGAGVLSLLGTGYATAKLYQEITVSAGDANTEHALRIEVSRGPVVLRIGSTAGDDDIFRQAVLRTGSHSIAFTPGGNFFIQFSSSLRYAVLVDSVAVEASGTMSLTTPWSTSALCKLVRWQQTGDVIYCACDGLQQRRIERRPNNSWSVVAYETNDGPFITENTETTRLTPSGISGLITLASSVPLFQEGHVGALFKMSSQGQTVAADLSAEATFTDPIRVTGVTDGRIFNIAIAGTFTATVSLQRSVGDVGAWVTVATYTTTTTTTYDDGLDNSIVYYRLGIEAGNYSADTAECSLVYDVGSITGVVRVTDFSSSTSVSAIVLQALGGTDPTEVWAEGAWSDVQGWPQAVAIGDDGRLWWSGNGRNWGSVPDAFSVFDPDIEGDSAPINRSIGTGAGNKTNWMLPLGHIVVGTGAAEHSIRSTSFDEPVTPLNYNTKSPSTKGSARVPAVLADDYGFFVGRNGTSLYRLEFDPQAYRYRAQNVTLLCPEVGEGGFVRLAVQMEPDIRVHCVKADGTVAVLVVDKAEDVLCWVDVETDGIVEDVVVLPGDDEDRVFYRVQRTLNDSTVRCHEEWAMLSECVGGTLNKLADSFVTGSGTVTAAHLASEDVVIWGDGEDRGTATLNGSGVASGHSYTSWCVGLPYTATYRSAKLAGQTQLGLSLSQRNRISKVGLLLIDTHAQGLEYGPDFTTMDPMPLVEDGADIVEESTYDEYDADMIAFPGGWDTDGRICLRATAPKNCTVSALVLNVSREDAD